MLQTIYSASERLLVAEGDWRRVRIELHEPEPEEQSAAVLAIADYKKDLGLAEYQAWGGLKEPPHEVAYCACRFTYATAVMPAEKTNGTTAPPEATAVREDCPRAAKPTPVVSPTIMEIKATTTTWYTRWSQVEVVADKEGPPRHRQSAVTEPGQESTRRRI